MHLEYSALKSCELCQADRNRSKLFESNDLGDVQSDSQRRGIFLSFPTPAGVDKWIKVRGSSAVLLIDLVVRSWYFDMRGQIEPRGHETRQIS